eukprot:m.45981 g.45981  ORF g.45981 m.45981 type:complete len:321 (-) comp10704_c0_seq3:131-1093(-)
MHRQTHTDTHTHIFLLFSRFPSFWNLNLVINCYLVGCHSVIPITVWCRLRPHQYTCDVKNMWDGFVKTQLLHVKQNGCPEFSNSHIQREAMLAMNFRMHCEALEYLEEVQDIKREGKNINTSTDINATPSLLLLHCGFEKVPLRNILDHVIADVTSIAIEKNSVAPDVTLNISDDISVASIPKYVSFILTEVVKNAFVTMVNEHCIDVGFQKPIDIRVSSLADGFVVIDVVDTGEGIELQRSRELFHFFHTSNKDDEKKEYNYKFSADFGEAIAGKGVGLSMARTYAQLLGGNVLYSTSHRYTQDQRGSKFHIVLPCDGL